MFSQIYLFNYPARIDKTSFSRKDMNSYILPNENNGELFLAIKDNKKIQYLLLNNFLLESRILSDSIKYEPVAIKYNDAQ